MTKKGYVLSPAAREAQRVRIAAWRQARRDPRLDEQRQAREARNASILDLLHSPNRPPTDEIADRFGVSTGSVYLIARKADIHVRRLSRPMAERFWEKVDKSGDCWVWTGALTRGYGTLGGPGRNDVLRAHRLSWEIHNGPIPDRLNVLHRCDNPPCVRPEHLFLGTFADNSQDMAAKARGNTARLTAEQVRELRALRAAGEPISPAAARMGVPLTTATDAARGKTWKALP